MRLLFLSITASLNSTLALSSYGVHLAHLFFWTKYVYPKSSRIVADTLDSCPACATASLVCIRLARYHLGPRMKSSCDVRPVSPLSMCKAPLPSVFPARPSRSSFAVEILHDVVLHQFLKALCVGFSSQPALGPRTFIEASGHLHRLYTVTSNSISMSPAM